ncbi:MULTISPECIES: hypothetical protein, partial [unclassified Microcoleus]|uniref:hypothetical protein n=1 Tax=unclassified Microcoleus TaxID=2642155 RepID=UPI002FD22D98
NLKSQISNRCWAIEQLGHQPADLSVARFILSKISNLKSQIDVGRSSNWVISLRIYQWIASFNLKSQI